VNIKKCHVQESASKVAELELENRKMKQELEEYRSETVHLKNQQATVRRLEERNRSLEQLVRMPFPWLSDDLSSFSSSVNGDVISALFPFHCRHPFPANFKTAV
jgi:phage terminase Nu1 subunit (DNA packaging protein)